MEELQALIDKMNEIDRRLDLIMNRGLEHTHHHYPPVPFGYKFTKVGELVSITPLEFTVKEPEGEQK